MYWLVFCKDEYFRNLINFYFLKETQNIILYSDFEKNDIENFQYDRIIFVKDEDKSILDRAKELNIFTTFITDEDKKYYEYDLSFRLVFLKKLIDDAFENKSIPSQFNYSHPCFVFPKILSCIKKRKKGEHNLVQKEISKAKDAIIFYGLTGVEKKEDLILKTSDICDFKNLDPFKIEKHIINVYMPTYYRYKKTKRSVESILNLCKTSKYDMKLFIGDNNTKEEEMKKWLKNLDCHVYFSDKNLGKSNIVNYLHKNARKCDYIFSIDSDMYAEDVENPLDKMIEYLERCDNIGLVSSNQKECSQHWFANFKLYTSKERDYKIGLSRDGVGISGGCIVMRTEDWEDIGMYKENHDIYTGDDGILTYNVNRKLNKRVIVSLDVFLVHPLPTEDEKGYTEWKSKSWKRDGLKFVNDNYTGENKKGYYD